MSNEAKQIKTLQKENELLKKKIEVLEEKLKKAGKLPTIVKYTIDNYNDELEKEKQILNRFNVPIWSISELCKRLVKVLEGDKFQGPLMTRKRLNNYFDLILQFSLKEYRNLKFAPKIYSDAMLFEKYEQIVDILQPLKPMRTSNTGFEDVTSKRVKKKVLENVEIEEDDEELDMSILSDDQ